MCLDNNLLCYNENQKNLKHCGNLPSYIDSAPNGNTLIGFDPTPNPTHRHTTHTHCAKDSISPLLLKFNIVLCWWRHVISFTNIT